MTENIKCPCCGSDDIGSVTLPRKRPERSLCISCYCEWDESQRQPPNAWIPCSERPPENEQDVVFYVTKKRYPFVTCGKYQHDRWIDLDGAYIDETQAQAFNCPKHDGITHWHPLSEPPKTESEV